MESENVPVSMSLISEPEEGEIFDVSYNPIERPVIESDSKVVQSTDSVTCQGSTIESCNGQKRSMVSSSNSEDDYDDDDDETSSSTSSSTDSSRAKNSKRLKIEPHKSVTATASTTTAAEAAMETDDVVATKSKNRHIWTTIATEDSLNNSLVNCEVGETFDRSRNVEAYDYRLSYSYRQATTETKTTSSGEDEDSTKNGELTEIPDSSVAATVTSDSTAAVASQSTNNSRKTKRNQKRKFVSGSNKSKDLFGCRKLPKLVNGVDASVDDLANEIAANLCESKSTLVGHVVRIAGPKIAIDLYEEVCAIEFDGGMSKEFGRKRRTSGGVYFFLVKNNESLTAEQKKEIFSEDQTINMKAKRKRRRKRELDSQQQQQEQNGQQTNTENTRDVVMSNGTDNNGNDKDKVLLLEPSNQNSAIIDDKTLDLDCDTDAALTKDIVLD